MVFVLVAPLIGRSGDQRPQLRQRLSSNWSTVEFRIQSKFDDQTTDGPALLIQKLDRERTIVSARDGGLNEAGLPFAIALITETGTSRLVEKLLALFEAAEKQHEEIYRSQPSSDNHWPHYTLTVIVATRGKLPDRQYYNISFDEEVSAWKAVTEFLRKATTKDYYE